VRDAHPALVSRRVWERAQERLEERAESATQRGTDQRLDAPSGERLYRRVGDLTGPRSRFLLSRLVTCARCGSRYEGFTQRSNGRDENGARTKIYTYACGGYIRRGRSVCTLGAVHQERLEGAVVGAVLEYYERYSGEKGSTLLGTEVRRTLGLEDSAVEESLDKVRRKLAKLDAAIRRLVDSVSPGTRGAIERRLKELDKERTALEARAESLERMSVSKADVRAVGMEAERFIAGLPLAVRSGTLEQRQEAIRKCVEGVEYDHARARGQVHVRLVPVSGRAGDHNGSRSIDLRLS
jgi:hypothetical protein